MESQKNSLGTFALILLVAGQLLPQIDFSIVNVALERIGQSLDTNDIGLVLIVAIYGLAYAAMIATGGRLGDRYGRKKIFLIGVIGFGLASVICGMSENLTVMLIGRLLQGVFGALLIPQILAIIHSSLSGERHSRAVGIYTSIGGLSFVLGQSLGGWLVSANVFDLGWRLTFFVNIPVCVFVLIFGFKVIPESQTQAIPKMDYAGISLFTLLLTCLLVPMSVGSHWPELWWLLLFTLPLSWMLWNLQVRKEAQKQNPVFPPSLFNTPKFVVGIICLMGVALTFPGYIFVTALTLQSKLHFTPLQSGNTFISMGLLYFLGSILSKRIGARIDDYRYYIIGISLTVIGFISTTYAIDWFGNQIQVWDLVIATAFAGFGNSCLASSAYRIALSHVEQNQASGASTVLNTVMQGCFPISTAISGEIYSITSSFNEVVTMTSVLTVLAAILMVVGIIVYAKRPVRQLASIKPQ
ncbi:MFS transporter [Vibrio sp. S4M6]|uniref:MFS transporter n=1 Tax=Vibrio sinus TaxID=2946865 RepID=UPI00202A2DAC|nr:MFS transporter [Vibrio sinus]MCL9782473.1 MFS transporter [Vibrio sinus]